MMKIKATENEILNSVCEYLTLKKYFFWRVNNISPYDASRGVFRKMPKYAMKGVPDIIAVIDGDCWGLEIKRKKSKQSYNQKEFERNFTKAGGKYYIIRSIDDLKLLGF